MERYATIEALIMVVAACVGLYFLTVGAATSHVIQFLTGLALYCAAWLYGLVRASRIPNPHPH